MPAPSFPLLDATRDPVDDAELESLLHRVYVEGGFAPPELATTLFAGPAVKARGHLLFARDAQGQLVGMVIVVPPTSPARKIAAPDEAEMHLLAVDPSQRGSGLGRALVEASLATARAHGPTTMVLWTQPTMHAAQRLYERCGFTRRPERDLGLQGRSFLVYTRAL